MSDSLIPTSLLQIYISHLPGFQPLVDSDSWRVAFLNFTNNLAPNQIDEFQRHNESNELFVLLSGRCILFLGDGVETITHIFAQDLHPFTLYCVQSQAWHTHALSPDAKLLIVENRNTSPANSPRIKITPDQQAELIGLTNLLWKENDVH